MEGDVTFRKSRALRAILLGLLTFAAGAALAAAFLPEWQAGGPEDRAFYVRRYRDLARRAGFRLDPGEPRARLTSWSYEIGNPYSLLGEGGAGWLRTRRSALQVEVYQPAARRAGERGRFFVDFALDGRPQTSAWWKAEPMGMFVLPTQEVGTRFTNELAGLSLGPGERLGPTQTVYAGAPFRAVPILGTRGPGEHFVSIIGGATWVHRRPGEIRGLDTEALAGLLRRSSSSGLVPLILFLGGAALFFGLLIRDRLAVADGALLGAASLLASNPAPTWSYGQPLFCLLAMFFKAVTVFFLWSASESLLRTGRHDFTTSLDSLRSGRIGPQAGRSLLYGFGLGSALAGLHLALFALAVRLPGVSPRVPSVLLPVLRVSGGPIADGVLFAAGVALAFTLAARILPARWAPWVAALAAGWLFSPVRLAPFWVSLAAQAVSAGVLVYALRRFGLTALLTAGLTAFLLPDALAAGRHLAWMPGGFALTAGLASAIVALGFVGLGRPAAAEAGGRPPAFLQRLEERRRIKYETGLLARMQSDLLPRRMPEVNGLDLAAHAMLATGSGGNLYEALLDDRGQLWVASGDVAGQGHACVIAQAMIKAALLSLIAPDLPPSEVLRRTDEVLAGVDAQRNSACLALLRIDPETGDGVIANAGHPPPLLFTGGEVTDLAAPGPPLGGAPSEISAGQYEDLPFRLPLGGAVLFGSEGFFQAADRKRLSFGADRARRTLRSRGAEPASRILEALLDRWRRHLGTETPGDDATLVVVKRPWGGRV